MMPSLFTAHGSPDIVLHDDSYTGFLKGLADKIDRPKAIVIFTAHWENRIQTIGGAEDYNLIYDFGGFSKELYEVKYNVKGNPELAVKIKEIFKGNGIESRVDEKRGLDHGAWSVLKLMYPDGKIPVVHMSVNPFLSNKEQYDIGKALQKLKNEGVLIIGSGGTVHNLLALNFYSKKDEKWAVEFDDFIKDRLENWDTDLLFKYESLAPNAKKAVPRNEHFVPLLIAMGAGDSLKSSSLLYRDYQFGSLSRLVFAFE